MCTVNNRTRARCSSRVANNRKVGRIGQATCSHLRCQKRSTQGCTTVTEGWESISMEMGVDGMNG